MQDPCKPDKQCRRLFLLVNTDWDISLGWLKCGLYLVLWRSGAEWSQVRCYHRHLVRTAASPELIEISAGAAEISDQ